MRWRGRLEPRQRSRSGIRPLPTRNPNAKAIEPVAGESGAYSDLPTADAADQPKAQAKSASAPLPKLRRTNGPTDDAAISNADVLKNGIALPPIEAPEEVRAIIEAGDQIARTPYLWGGGHGKWLDHGYDCSGSVSFALANAGLLRGPQDLGCAGGLGCAGQGQVDHGLRQRGSATWSSPGVRFDERQPQDRLALAVGMRSGGGFVARHPPGL